MFLALSTAEAIKKCCGRSALQRYGKTGPRLHAVPPVLYGPAAARPPALGAQRPQRALRRGPAPLPRGVEQILPPR